MSIQSPESKPCKILVTDNDEMSRLILVRQLERIGYSATAVSSGAETLLRVAAGGVDAILLDCLMPGMDGYETARQVRLQGGAGSTVPIVAYTANIGTGEREKCLAAGMDAYIAKPVQLEKLKATLDGFLKPGKKSSKSTWEGRNRWQQPANNARPVLSA